MLGILIVAFLVVIYFTSIRPLTFATAYEDYITGFWAADSLYCDAAGIDGMIMYFGPRAGVLKNTRRGHCVITPGVCCQGFNVVYNTSWYTGGSYKIRCRLEMADQVMPRDVTVTVDMRSGKMLIKSGGTLYARLYKNHSLSDLADTRTK